jgi:uncharacterized protein (UPF0333 family)
MISRKGQSSIETLIVFLFIMFMLLMVAIYASEKSNEATNIKTQTDMRRVADSFADNVNTIAEQGSGFYKYFRLPAQLVGVQDYNVSIYGNLVEISCNNYSVIEPMVSSNITVACLDKSISKRNKVYNDGEKIFIICDKPELIFVNGSLWLTYANGSLWPPNAYINQSVNLSIKVMNFGPADSGPFWVSFNGNKTTATRIDSLKSEGIAEVPPFQMNASAIIGAMAINVSIDYNNSVDESIETNNNFTVYLNVLPKT